MIKVTGSARELLRQILNAVRYREVRDKVRYGENITVVRQNLDTDETLITFGSNIVTDSGDLFYAQKAVGGTPTINYLSLGSCRMGTGAGVPSKTSTDCSTFFGVGKAVAATYPKTNDGDASNTGAGLDIASWKFDWATSENNGSSMTNGAITDSTTAPTNALAHFTITPVTKTSSQTMSIFVNHRFNGV